MTNEDITEFRRLLTRDHVTYSAVKRFAGCVRSGGEESQ